jgi:hypothetical protein
MKKKTSTSGPYRQVPIHPRLAGGDESAQSKNNQI